MYERHENEQYFFSNATLDELASFVARWERPCVLCAPLLGSKLASEGVSATVLDIDRRFEEVPGFVYYDVQRPHYLADRFDLIVCDPPFFNVSLSRLFAAIRELSHNDFSQPLLISYLHRREAAILGTFGRFDIRPTGYRPEYQTVKAVERNDIRFFSNLEPEQLAPLTADLGETKPWRSSSRAARVIWVRR